MGKTKAPVEELVDVKDPDVLWWDIPLFTGYQITNKGFEVRETDGTPYGTWIKSQLTPTYTYRGKKCVYLYLQDGTRVRCRNNELWDLVVKAQMPQKTTQDAVYTGDYNPDIFVCNAVTGLPDNFKVLTSQRKTRKDGYTNGAIQLR